MADVTMPKLSDTMEEGKILRWLKKAGERVEVGDLLVEVETDKADMEVEASAAGVLREVKLGEGESAAVGVVIAVIDGAGEAAPRASAASQAAPAGERKQGAAPPMPPGGQPARKQEPSPAPRAASSPAAHDVKASRLAQTLAEELGVDVSAVRGTGPAGRVTRRDVEEAHAGAAGGSTGAPGVRRVTLSRMRAAIAKRMAESKRTTPHFYLTTVVDMEEAVRLRQQLKALEASSAGVTYNHMVVKAVADALLAFPEVNARFADDAIEIQGEVNVGIATAVDEGLVVPVLRGADRLGLLEIAAAARALADKAEGGRFSSAELSGATFSVSNLGMFDVDSFSAVINPPQAAILAVGSVKQRPVVHDGALAVGYTMALTLSCDHRVLDGASGGRFLADVKRRLENPASLLLSGTKGR